MVGYDGIEKYENEVNDYFPFCPFCGNTQLTMNLIPGGKDTLSCSVCSAYWHLFIGIGGLKSAVLEQSSQNGQGKNLVRKRYDKSQWRKYLEKSKARNVPLSNKLTSSKIETNQIIREREIIREKEVIVKVRCSYCKTPYNEILDCCPHCGGKN